MESPFKGKTGLQRLINAFRYSVAGLTSAFVHEDAFRQEVFLSIILIPLAFFLGHSTIQRVLMISSIIVVLIVELFNSAIEASVDHTSIEQHPLAKRAKDMGSAAVFLALSNVIIIWTLIIFW